MTPIICVSYVYFLIFPVKPLHTMYLIVVMFISLVETIKKRRVNGNQEEEEEEELLEEEEEREDPT